LSEKRIRIIKFLFIFICVVQLFYIFHFRSGFNYEIIKNPFSKDAGILQAVSPEVTESKRFLTKHSLSDFSLSIGIKENTYLYQRFIEFNYPIRFKDESISVFFLKNENLPVKCEVIDEGEYLKFTKCKQ